ncbi:EF-hand [Lactarius tabidus]
MYFDNFPPPVGFRGPGGFKASPQAKPRPPPPGADPQLWEWFDKVDKDQSGDIDATELQSALINGEWSHFDLNTINLLMNIVDLDRNDRIDFNEFADLWTFIKGWQRAFDRFDTDKSGTIDRTELQNALTDFGYLVTPQLLNILQRKYDVNASVPQACPGPKSGAPPAGVTFDRFVRACVVLHQVTEAFNNLHTNREGWVKIDYLQFLQTVLSLP